MSDLVCAMNRCRRPPCDASGTLCESHYDIVHRLVPDRLDKQLGHGTLVCAQLDDQELKAVAAQVERDAFPLFLLAWNWCGLNAIAKIAGKKRTA